MIKIKKSKENKKICNNMSLQKIYFKIKCHAQIQKLLKKTLLNFIFRGPITDKKKKNVYVLSVI